MKLPKLKIGRYAVCILLVVAVCLLYEARLFQWQILEGEAFEEQSLSNRTDAMELTPERGQIFDRDGEVLAGNRTSYNIVYNALNMDYDRRNATIIEVLDILDQRGEKWRDRLPIVLDEDGSYRFLEDKEDEIAALKGQDMLGLGEYATAEDCMAALFERYDCGGYSNEDARNVASVRYSMTMDGFSRTNPYVIAQGVSPETVGVISQRSGSLQGIETRVAVTRYYGEEGDLAPHIVGNVGAISDEQYRKAVENGTDYDSETNLSGYKWTDTLGQSGIEQAFESTLRGQRGVETIFTDDTGEVQSTAVTTPPQEGNSIFLTLDADLQRVANLSLAKNIKNNVEARNCTAGAAVVLDPKTFGVLACATYPTFDMNLYTTDDAYYNQLIADKTSPLFNRALDGVFVPGSIFKPMVALAALQEGVTTAGRTVYCNGTYEYADLKLGCLSSYGDFNVYNALAESCNVYFCTIGMDLTIRRMDAYAEYFGLGEPTGIELSEALGIMSNPLEYKQNNLTDWTDGVTAQAAIGQADNMFTPIQLATYCATIANRGKRLQTHFLDRITDYDGAETLETFQPKQLYDAGLSSDVVDIVWEGMRMAASSGTASDVFGEYPISVCAKTGTAETSADSSLPGATQDNISVIAFAPADDPQIAVAVMLEYGNKGSYAKNVAKDILDQFFGFYTWDAEGNRYDADGNLVDDAGEIVKTAQELAEEKAGQSDGQPTVSPSPTPENGEDDGSDAPDEPGRDDIPQTPYDVDGKPGPAASPEPNPSAEPPTRDFPYYFGPNTALFIGKRAKV